MLKTDIMLFEVTCILMGPAGRQRRTKRSGTLKLKILSLDFKNRNLILLTGSQKAENF